MIHWDYTRLGRSWRRLRVFRLNFGRCFDGRRRRLHVKLSGFLRLLKCWLKPLKRGCRRSTSTSISERRRCDRSVSRRGLVAYHEVQRGSRGCCSRSNSFYAEAIADCLEFIKRTSVSFDGDGYASSSPATREQ